MELLGKKAELSETIQSLTEEKIKLEEEIQVLTAQVNAYSRECEKQKGLVAQNQGRHKTEVYMYCIAIHLTCIIILDPRTK